MTRKYLVYALIAVAAALAGCVFLQGAAPAVKQVENGIAPLISLPTDVPSAPSSPVAAFDLDGASWMEYRLIDGNGGTGDVRLEYSQGGRMVSIRRTLSSSDVSSMSSNDGGMSYSMRHSSSQSSTSSNTAPVDRVKADDPVLYADGLTAGPAGSDCVTVPGGTYDCKKYLTSFKGSDATYWGAPGVPVPVKIYTACDGTTLELVGWGL
jgi:hypothetical protein